MRTQGDASAVVDLVPVDHVCNAIVAAAWRVGGGAGAAVAGGGSEQSLVSSSLSLSSSSAAAASASPSLMPIFVVGTSQHNPLQWKWLIEVTCDV